MMKTVVRSLSSSLGLGLALVLAACGGGGGSSGTDAGTTPVTPRYPTRGSYAPVLKVLGSTTEPRRGLSLVHPDDPGVEYMIEDGSKSVSDTLTLYAGVVNAAAGRVDQITPHTLLYIAGGIVRAVPLLANGEAPSSALRGQATLSMSACRFMQEPNANNYADPTATRIGVIAQGPDNRCGTADDVPTPYYYDPALNLVQLVGGGSTGNFVRDPQTLAPSYQVMPYSLVSPSAAYAFMPYPGPSLRRMVISSPGMAVMELGSSEQDIQLVALDVVRRSYVELGPVATGANWQALGHDASAYYLYRNASAASSTSWTVLRNSKSQPQAVRMASGTGQVLNAAMGQGQLYLTVQQPAGNRLYAVAKASPHALVQLEATPPDRMSVVLASAGQVHLFLRVSGAGASATTSIDMVDEAGVVRATAASALPLALVEPASIDFSRSENRTRFLFAAGMGAQGYGDASLQSYDAGAGGSGLEIGRLPGTSTLGGSAVFAHSSAALGNAVAGQVVSSANGSFLANGSRVFSFKADTPNSLVFTSRVR